MSRGPSHTRSHEQEIEIDAPPEVVWKAITDPRELERWFPLRAEVAPGADGRLTYSWGEGITGTCRIDVWDPPRRLRTGWMPEFLPQSATPAERARVAVDWTLVGKGGKTVLRLVTSGFGSSANFDQEYDGTRRGWNYELAALQHYLERHRARERRAFWVRRPIAGDGEGAFARLFGAAGLCAAGSFAGKSKGDGFDVTAATGDRLAGVVLDADPPREIAGFVANLGDAMFRAGVETCADGTQAHLFVSTWGQPAAEVAALERRASDLLARLFP